MLRFTFIVLLLSITCSCVTAQCPVNMGFENGTFDNWELFAGKISTSTGEVTSMNPTFARENTNFQIIDNEAAAKDKTLDEFGFFPVNSPNGSKYSVKIGLPSGGSDIFKLTYTFKAPDTQLEDYSIIYNYAVVLQDREHQPHLQPKLDVKVFNVTDNQYIDCGSFNFIASKNLPGFFQSNVNQEVFYKSWAPITLKLSGFANKILRLEFTINDCAPGGHFGYAYLDINENCTTPITGNVFCTDNTNTKLTAPYGFQGYRWFNSDFSKELGSQNILTLTPALPAGTVLALEITPFPNQGCLDTLYTTITRSFEPFEFVMKNRVDGCQQPGIDLTVPDITAGSTPGMRYSYFSDIGETVFVSSPKSISTSGTYYVKAENKVGCTDTKPLIVNLNPNPTLQPKSPEPECLPNTVNLSDPAIYVGGRATWTYTYWKDGNATQPVTEDVSRISVPGMYFIKTTNEFGCTDIKAVGVAISKPPVVVVNQLTECGQLELSKHNPAAGTDPTATVSYWFDATATTNSIPPEYVFTQTTDYAVRARSIEGCNVIKTTKVIINPLPDFTVTTPATVKLPSTINITQTVPSSNDWQYSYWEDSLATKPLIYPERVLSSGRYFVKATTAFGCSITKPIPVTIEDAVITPPNAFSPNGDGINDVWIIPLLEYYPNAIIEVFTRTGQPVYKNNGYTRYWDGRGNDGKPLPTGVYYYVIKAAPHLKPISGSISILY